MGVYAGTVPLDVADRIREERARKLRMKLARAQTMSASQFRRAFGRRKSDGSSSFEFTAEDIERMGHDMGSGGAEREPFHSDDELDAARAGAAHPDASEQSGSSVAQPQGAIGKTVPRFKFREVELVCVQLPLSVCMCCEALIHSIDVQLLQHEQQRTKNLESRVVELEQAVRVCGVLACCIHLCMHGTVSSVH